MSPHCYDPDLTTNLAAAQYWNVPDTRPTGPGQMRSRDTKAPRTPRRSGRSGDQRRPPRPQRRT